MKFVQSSNSSRVDASRLPKMTTRQRSPCMSSVSPESGTKRPVALNERSSTCTTRRARAMRSRCSITVTKSAGACGRRYSPCATLRAKECSRYMTDEFLPRAPVAPSPPLFRWCDRPRPRQPCGRTRHSQLAPTWGNGARPRNPVRGPSEKRTRHQPSPMQASGQTRARRRGARVDTCTAVPDLDALPKMRIVAPCSLARPRNSRNEGPSL